MANSISSKKTYGERLLDDVHKAARALSKDVSSSLFNRLDGSGAQYDEEKVEEHMYRAFRRVLSEATRRESSPVLMFNDAIPGFTLMLLRYSREYSKNIGHVSAVDGEVEDNINPQSAAAVAIMSAFVKRTGNRVLVIEATDSIFLLFPSDDLKQNLRKLSLAKY